MKNSEAKQLLINEYGRICFLGDIITKTNILTYHHLIKVQNNGKATFENGALLSTIKHQSLNVFEHENIRKYREINDYLRYFKETRDMIAREQMRVYIEQEIAKMGYEIENRGKILTLKRRH